MRVMKDLYDVAELWHAYRSRETLVPPDCPYAGPPALVTKTSGTTGTPKHVVLPWEALKTRYERYAELLSEVHVLVVTFPNSTAIGASARLAGLYMPGTKLVKPPPVSGVLDLCIDRHNVTCLLTDPATVLRMVRKGAMPRRRTLRRIILTGTPVSAEDLLTLQSCFGCVVVDGYGSAEVGMVAYRVGPQPSFRRLFAPIRITDGWIEVTGDTLASSYVEGPLPLNEGWFRTRDKGRLEGDALFLGAE